MNYPCEMIQDLFPLYEEGLCSPASRTAVEEHLRECAGCRAAREATRVLLPAGPPLPDTPEQAARADQAAAKGLRKVKRRWRLSLTAALLALPLLLLCVNQWRGEGLCFTNLDDVWAARRYAAALADGDYKTAADCMDYDRLYEEIQTLKTMEPEDFGTRYVAVEIGGESWMAAAEFAAEQLAESADGLTVWANLVYNAVPGILVPTDVWTQVTALEPEAVLDLGDGEYSVAGVTYRRHATRWGSFMAPDSFTAPENPTAAGYCAALQLVPLALYEEAEPDLPDCDAIYAEVQQTYAEAFAMTREEFTQAAKARYLAQLTALGERNVSFSAPSYGSCYYYRDGGYWLVEYRLRLHDPSAGDGIFSAGLSVRGGKLTLSSMGYASDFEASSATDALWLHWSA